MIIPDEHSLSKDKYVAFNNATKIREFRRSLTVARAFMNVLNFRKRKHFSPIGMSVSYDRRFHHG
jgi:hypothetical protein